MGSNEELEVQGGEAGAEAEAEAEAGDAEASNAEVSPQPEAVPAITAMQEELSENRRAMAQMQRQLEAYEQKLVLQETPTPAKHPLADLEDLSPESLEVGERLKAYIDGEVAKALKVVDTKTSTAKNEAANLADAKREVAVILDKHGQAKFDLVGPLASKLMSEQKHLSVTGAWNKAYAEFKPLFEAQAQVEALKGKQASAGAKPASASSAAGGSADAEAEAGDFDSLFDKAAAELGVT